MFAVWDLSKFILLGSGSTAVISPNVLSVSLFTATDTKFAGQQGQYAKINGLRLTLPSFTESSPISLSVRLNAVDQILDTVSFALI